MIPLLTSAQVHDADQYTISHGPVTSLDLMERASKAFMLAFVEKYTHPLQKIAVYCGTGNNGGDGLAVALLLRDEGYKHIDVKIVRFSQKSTGDFDANLVKLKHIGFAITEINPGDGLPDEPASIIIDALLGSGLNKPLSGDYERLVTHLNQLNKTVVAVDVPTGFFTDGEVDKDATVLKAKLVITFQQVKINFLLPESAAAFDEFKVVNIALDDGYIQSLNSPYQLLEKGDIRKLIIPRKRFDFKGTHGHALIIAGQQLTMGAALICSSACAHTGAGLTTACIPEGGLTALNTMLPEVMAIVRKGTEKPEINWEKFSTIGIGPGLGTHDDSLELLKTALNEFKKPMVIDADALNMIAKNPELFTLIPKGSILTPHMKEFDRLFGEHTSWWQRLQTLQQKTKELGIYVVLKNSFTAIGTPDGKVYFNPTSNPAMGSGGMGDALTGIITALVTQKYPPGQAAIIGVYLHGKTGDDIALPNKTTVVLAGKLAAQVPVTLAKLMA